MATKELTAEDKQKELYRLQLIDSELDDIKVLKGELPMEVSDLEDELAGLQTRIDKLQTSVNSMETDVANHKNNIVESNILIERYTKQLDDVKNNREYDALSKEIELQKLEIELSEKKIGNIDKDREAKNEVLANAQERFDVKQKALEEKKVELEKIIAKTEKEEQKLQKRTEKQRKLIEDRLLNAYDRIRASYRNGLAVAYVERDSCGGCFAKIPPQVQIEIGQRKKIIACEHCGRVLVDENILESNVETAS